MPFQFYINYQVRFSDQQTSRPIQYCLILTKLHLEFLHPRLHMGCLHESRFRDMLLSKLSLKLAVGRCFESPVTEMSDRAKCPPQ
jgi:hypothetical protein